MLVGNPYVGDMWGCGSLGHKTSVGFGAGSALWGRRRWFQGPLANVGPALNTLNP